MSNLDFSITEAGMERDPRKAPWGIFTGSSFVLASSRVFVWFETLEDLSAYLTNGLFEGYNVDEDDVEELCAQLSPLASRVRSEGLNPQLLAAINDVVKAVLSVDWWGNFDELLANGTEFSRRISSGFLDEDDFHKPIQEDEMDEFIDYLKTCAV